MMFKTPFWITLIRPLKGNESNRAIKNRITPVLLFNPCLLHLSCWSASSGRLRLFWASCPEQSMLVWMCVHVHHEWKILYERKHHVQPLIPGKIRVLATCSVVPMWLLCDDAPLSCPQRDTIQTVSSSALLHMLCRSLSRILEKR